MLLHRTLPIAVYFLPLILAQCGGAAELPEHQADQETTGAEIAVGVLLTGEARADVLRQCTRRMPFGVTGFWTPSRETIAELERRLPAHVDGVLDRLHRGNPDRSTARDYRHQYVGIVRGNRRLVYVNGFHRWFLEEHEQSMTRALASASEGAPDVPHWRTAAIQVCDGGAGFFGVEYDPERRGFGRLEFNHRWDGPVRY